MAKRRFVEKGKETLYDKAVSNYDVAKGIYDFFDGDELYLNHIGYHLQQAVELSLKYTLEMHGTEYPKTHEIETLISLAKDNHVDWFKNQYIYDHSEMLSSWEAKTRYIVNYRLELEKITAAMPEIAAYLYTVGIQLGVYKYMLKETENEDIYQIRAKNNFGNVSAGDFGGSVTSNQNLSHADNCWITEHASVIGDSRVSGDVIVKDSACVDIKGEISGQGIIGGNIHLQGTMNLILHGEEINERTPVLDIKEIEFRTEKELADLWVFFSHFS